MHTSLRLKGKTVLLTPRRFLGARGHEPLPCPLMARWRQPGITLRWGKMAGRREGGTKEGPGNTTQQPREELATQAAAWMGLKVIT